MKFNSQPRKPLAAVLLGLCMLPALVCPSFRICRAAPAPDRFTFAAYGDSRSDAATHRKVIALILSMHPEFAIQTGDMVYHGKSSSEWQEFSQIIAALQAANVGYYPARGNHDLGPYYIQYVPTPWETGNGYYYAFTKHNLRFIAVDCFEDYSAGSTQYKWLEDQLANARGNGQFTIVYFHEPPFSVGPHGDNRDVQAVLHPLFASYHVPLVFCGHDHLYYRTKRDGVVYVVTGGGGAELYPPINTQYAIPGDVYQSVHHAIRCDVDGNSVHCTVLTPDGKTIDDFTVTGS